MRMSLLRIAVSLLTICSFASASHAADQGTTLRSKDVPYSATITLQDAGQDTDGKKLIAYRINLSSAKCKSVIAGNAKFFAKTDGQQDDSTFLQNGDVVKTNIFKDHGKDGDITLTMDIESKRPQYAGILIDNAPAGGGCFKLNNVSFDFYK